MSNNNNYIIMKAVLGAVLAFQGAKLVGAVLQDRPENYILFAACGIAFIAIGVVFAVNSIKNYLKLRKEGDVEVISYEDMKKEEAKKGEDESCE